MSKALAVNVTVSGRQRFFVFLYKWGKVLTVGLLNAVFDLFAIVILGIAFKKEMIESNFQYYITNKTDNQRSNKCTYVNTHIKDSKCRIKSLITGSI